MPPLYKEAILLVGGKGTRLRVAVPDLPKPLAPVNGRPFASFILENLARHGFQKIIMATGYRGAMIENTFGSSFKGMDLVYSHEDEPLGTGGALARAISHAGSSYVFALNGDTLLDIDYGDMERHVAAENMVIAGVFRDDVSRFGGLLFADGVERRIAGFLEKGNERSGWINAGCYLLSRDIFDERWKGKTFSFETEFIPDLLRKKTIQFFAATGEFWDIGTPGDYQGFIKRQSGMADNIYGKGGGV